jgi:sugar phosphate isomerase/epimerase
MAPGATLDERLAVLEECGYEGVEIGGGNLPARVDEINRAVGKTKLKVSSICAGYRGSMLDADKSQRETMLADAKDILSAAADLGAVGLIVVPVFGPPRVPDLSPFADPRQLESQLFPLLLADLGEHAAKVKCMVFVEPLNRYETHFLNRLEQAIEFTKKLANPYVKIMADFFHMSIEEADIPQSLKAAGDWVQHVHLADSNRVLPGLGHTDFKAGLAALKSIGFDKYMAMECGVPGDRKPALKKSADYLKKLM